MKYDRLKCFFGFHNWSIAHDGLNHRNLIHLHLFADTIHICSECYIVRNYLHTTSDKLLEMHEKGLFK